MKLLSILCCLGLLSACVPANAAALAVPSALNPTITTSPTRQKSATPIQASATPLPAATATSQPTPLPPVAPQISAGEAHTCLLQADGGVRCWGWNAFGQTGSKPSQSTWPPAELPLEGITQISAGAYHSCALDFAGKVYCWGRNNQGQLGSGSQSDSYIPVQVTALSAEKITSITSGSFHTCALNAAGQTWCWGSNMDGKLGAGSTSDMESQPAAVAGEHPAFINITAGGTFTCAAGADGSAWCWGDGSSGETGSKAKESSPLPVQVSGVADVTSLSAGWEHVCVLTAAGNTACWGKNYAGELGNSSRLPRYLPAPVTGLSGKQPLRLLSAGGQTTCAVTTQNQLFCWGRNDAGQAGAAARVDQLLPIQITGISGDIQSLTVGGSHACALTGSGQLYCWGANDLNQLGAAAVVDSSTPVRLETPDGD
jgi:alpha-tubulin suppressor-like RCC1 family protein